MNIKYSYLFMFIGISIILWVLLICLTGCTLSFQNITIDTVQGQSDDKVEDSLSPINDIKPDVNLSLPKGPL